jgi:hypothetical protein
LVHLVGFITKKFVGSYYISMVTVFRAVSSLLFGRYLRILA